MTKYDRDYCKPDENDRPLYCPLPLAVVIHHHDEGDDPETGEHWERDWDEKRTEVFPTDADKALMGYLPLSSDWPVDPPDGKHYERTGKIEPNGDDGYRWQYILVDDPPPEPRVFSKINLEAAVFKRGLLAKLDAFVDAQTITNEMGDTMPLRRAYNTAQTFREDHPLFAPYLAAAKQALGVDGETAEAILSEAIAVEGV
jgi:hypothetical protein